MQEMPSPTPEMMASPAFNAIWQAIKTWDVNVPASYVGYCGANGSHVVTILAALKEAGLAVVEVEPEGDEAVTVGAQTLAAAFRMAWDGLCDGSCEPDWAPWKVGGHYNAHKDDYRNLARAIYRAMLKAQEG